MNEVKKFLSARRELMIDHGVGNVGFLEFATRMGTLIELIDEARTPVADKALSLWLESGTPHRKGWLRVQPADVILGYKGPVWVLNNDVLYLSQAVIDSSQFTLRTKVGDSGSVYVAGLGVGASEVLDKIGDTICKSELVEDLKAEIDKIDARGGHTINMTVNVDGKCIANEIKSAIEAGLSQTIYPLREECADAAQWFYQVKDAAMPGGPQWLKNNPADWIISRARAHLDALNSKRQPVADAALTLWTVFGARVGSLCETCPIDLLSKFDNERAFHADKARDVYFKRVGVPSYIQDQMMVMGWDWIESEWLSLQGPKRCGTRIKVKRLGTLQRSGEFGVAFYKGGVAFHEERFTGYIAMGANHGYARNTQITDYDEYRVIGDACVSVEAIYESR